MIENEKGKSELDLLIERIHAIQDNLPKHKTPMAEDEEAFSEGADEHAAAKMLPRRLNKMR